MPDHSESPEHAGYSEDCVQQEVTELQAKSGTAARIFDLRRIIDGLFVLYGVIVTIADINPPDATSTRPRASTSTCGRASGC